MWNSDGGAYKAHMAPKARASARRKRIFVLYSSRFSSPVSRFRFSTLPVFWVSTLLLLTVSFVLALFLQVMDGYTYI